jgi:hypothetical protein
MMLTLKKGDPRRNPHGLRMKLCDFQADYWETGSETRTHVGSWGGGDKVRLLRP